MIGGASDTDSATDTTARRGQSNIEKCETQLVIL